MVLNSAEDEIVMSIFYTGRMPVPLVKNSKLNVNIRLDI